MALRKYKTRGYPNHCRAAGPHLGNARCTHKPGERRSCWTIGRWSGHEIESGWCISRRWMRNCSRFVTACSASGRLEMMHGQKNRGENRIGAKPAAERQAAVEQKSRGRRGGEGQTAMNKAENLRRIDFSLPDPFEWPTYFMNRIGYQNWQKFPSWLQGYFFTTLWRNAINRPVTLYGVTRTVSVWGIWFGAGFAVGYAIGRSTASGTAWLISHLDATYGKAIRADAQSMSSST